MKNKSINLNFIFISKTIFILLTWALNIIIFEELDLNKSLALLDKQLYSKFIPVFPYPN